MLVSVDDIRRVADIVLRHLEHTGRSTINVTHEFYWSIPKSERYDEYSEPKEFTVGQLSDDWGELQKILSGQAQPIGYALVWLASIMSAAGESAID